LENILGLRINVIRGAHEYEEEFERYEFISDYETTKLTETKNHIIVDVGEESIGANVKVYVEGEFLCNATVSSNGTFKINKKSGIGKELLNAMKKGKDIYVEVD
jgi:ATPase